MANTSWPVAESAESSLPVTLRSAVRQEFGRELRAPYETFITVAVNGAMMSSAWFFLPKSLKDKVFTLHGTLAFALVLGLDVLRRARNECARSGCGEGGCSYR